MAFTSKGQSSGVAFPTSTAGKFLRDDNSWAAVTAESSIEDSPVDGHTTIGISSNWANDHSNNTLTAKHITASQISALHNAVTVSGNGITLNGQELTIDFTKVAAYNHTHPYDDDPVDAHTTIAISSNWAYDHEANTRSAKHISASQLANLHAPVTVSGTGLTLAGQNISIDYNAVSAAHTHEQYLTDAPSDSLYYARRNGSWQTFTTGTGGDGDIVGPSSATDRAVALFNGTTGKSIQNSAVTIDSSGSVNIPSDQLYKINGVAHTHNYLTESPTDGSIYGRQSGSWVTISGSGGSLPTQTDNAGKFLRTDGSSASWQVAPSNKEIIYTIDGEINKTVFMYYRVPASCTLNSFIVSVGNKPEGQDITVDIRKNSTISGSMLSSQVTIPTGATATNGIYSSTGTLSSTALVAGDVLYCMVTQVGTTFKGTDMLIQVILS